MKCNCGQDACVHLTVVEEGDVKRETHMCRACAKCEFEGTPFAKNLEEEDLVNRVFDDFWNPEFQVQAHRMSRHLVAKLAFKAGVIHGKADK